MDIKIPDDVTAHVRKHFANCNEQVSEDLSRFPSIHEESLDFNFISYFSRNQLPVKLASDWIVRIDAHFIGGGRHFGTWEVADIGLMMVFRRKGQVVRSKLALLQSKKLYANTLQYREESPHLRPFGLGRLLVPDEEHSELVEDKLLVFKENSRYLAYRKDSEQQKTMGHFERRWDMELHHLFYNPVTIPHAAKMPVESVQEVGENQVGCRIVSKSRLDSALQDRNEGYSPTYSDLMGGLPDSLSGVKCKGGWRLEDFVAHLMLQCRAGLLDESPNYESMTALMTQKSRPMSAALSITFDFKD